MQGEELKIRFQCEYPVAGFECVPRVTDARNRNVPDDSLTFEWYRLQKVEKHFCSVHPSKLATFQCICCVKLYLPVQFSYYCSLKCFHNSWSHHKEKHEEAIRTTKLALKLEDDPKSYDPFWSAYRHQQSLLQSSSLPEESQPDENDQFWCKIASSKTYKPVAEDIGCILGLTCTPVNSVPKTLLWASVTAYTSPVLPFTEPPIRRMVPVGSIGAKNDSGCETFSVLSYNVLSDIYATPSAHWNSPSWVLAWEYRWQNLLHEIVQYKADILCLQEVQSDHFKDFFALELEKLGYLAAYKRKRNGVYTGEQYVGDGCAIFFHSKRFEKVNSFEVEFDTQIRAEIEGRKLDVPDLNRLMKGGNIALVVVLATKNGAVSDSSKGGTSHSICVANTHILANEEFSDVKLLQVYILLSELERRISGDKLPILLCADLNSLPRSAAYDLVVRGKVDPSHPGLKVDPTGILQNLTLSHTLHLVSAYTAMHPPGNWPLLERGSGSSEENLVDSETREPNFTHFSCNFVGTIDYIFFTDDTLMVNDLLEPLSFRIPTMTGPLPSQDWSSDHIALMARFRFRNSGSPPTPVSKEMQTSEISAPKACP